MKKIITVLAFLCVVGGWRFWANLADSIAFCCFSGKNQ
jgi:hypothetical protein